MDNRQLRNKVASGVFWTFGERIFAQGVSFIVSLILARLLMPDEYGAVSMTMVFIALANVLVSNGLGEALVQKKDSDEKDFSTIFICSVLLSLILYPILFFGAPWVSEFYGMDLTLLLRVLGLKIPIAAINSIQHAYVAKNMIFKKLFWSNSIGTVISGILGISAACLGWGPWALALQYLSNSVIGTIVLFVVLPWRPRFEFHIDKAKQLVSYGWKIMLSSLINTGFTELRALLIGRRYTSADLAFYDKGNQFPALVINNIDTAIGKVVFPAMSAVNDDKQRLKAMARRSVSMITYIVFPIMVGLFAVADNLVLLLLTEKWLDSVFFLRLACIFYALQPLQTADWQIIKASGKADLCVKLEFVKKSIGVALLIGASFISVEAVGISGVVLSLISVMINMIPARKLADYTILQHISDISVSVVYSVFMGVAVYLLKDMTDSVLLNLLIQVITGAAIYIGLSALTKYKVFFEFLSIAKSFFQKK